MIDFDAIVVSGGRSTRMGAAKISLDIGGRPMLVRVTDALTAAQRVVVVGQTVPGARADVVCRESPSGRGPVPAIAAGLVHCAAAAVVVVAADLPFLTSSAIAELVDGLAGVDRCLAVDDAMREQYLLSAWRAGALRVALDAVAGLSHPPVRLVGAESVRRVSLRGDPPPWFDCDDPATLAEARGKARQAWTSA